MFNRFNLQRAARFLPALVLLTCGLTAGNIAQAGPITFTTDPGNSTAEFVDTSGLCLGIGCTPTVVVNSTAVTFDLEDIRDSFSILDFLTVSINANAFVLGGEGTLEASIAFSAPSSAVSSIATATGTFTSFFRFRQNGTVTWDSQPANLLFSDGTEITLAFSGGSDSCRSRFQGGSGCRHGLSVGVDATTTLQAVPEPGALALLSAGLLGFGAYRRFGRVQS